MTCVLDASVIITSFATFALGDAVLREARAIDIQPQLRRGHVLVQVHVRGAGDLRDAIAHGRGRSRRFAALL